jgi:polyhydroxybutyrate depolymerase
MKLASVSSAFSSAFWGFALLAVFGLSDVAAAAPSQTEEKLDVGGRTRTFLVHDYSGGKPAPLVILLHGGGGNAENAVNMTQFDVIAEREHLIAVYPNGTGQTRLLTWNAGHCCAYARENNIDDVGFISAIIDKLAGANRIDPKRVYVTGMSNGGMMSHVIGRELSTRVAAIAPVVGALFGDEKPPKGPVPAIIFNGADDKTVPGEGGPIGGNRGDGPLGRLQRPPADRDVIPARAAAEYWVAADGCTNPATSTPKGATLVLWTNCKGGAEVAFYTVANNGHAWPGGRAGRAEANQPTQDFNASETMWAFFKRHTR